jgi:hypothetical protein
MLELFSIFSVLFGASETNLQPGFEIENSCTDYLLSLKLFCQKLQILVAILFIDELHADMSMLIKIISLLHKAYVTVAYVYIYFLFIDPIISTQGWI